ncbi:MAG: ABC transporter transmembrane domain-containing protein, partial [Chitinophagales bacterium]|nr:ABC transporter transmembrane domain-containing protein [Chitinophagales bacterium]MDW8419602.1 ABC transporter transmembrane domain-containing protein [Chitinophagales bacterium]
MLQAFAPLKKYLWKYRWRLLAGVFFVISANALNSYTPIITGSAVNLISQKITQAAQQTLPNGASTISVGKEIVMLFLKYLLVALLAGGFTFMMRQTIIVVSRRIECDMKADIYDHYQRLDLAFYRKNNTGDLMNRITEDVSRVRMFIGPAVMYGVNLLFSIIFCVSYMLMLNKTLTLYVLIPLPVLAFLIYYLNDKIESAGSRIQAKLSDLTTFAQETYSGIRVVQAYACERTMLSSFVEESEKYRRLQLKLAKLDALYFPVMTFLVGVSIVIVIW